MLKKVFLFLLIVSFAYGDLLNISQKNKNIYDKLAGNWSISYELDGGKFILDMNISKAYFNTRVGGFVVDIFDNLNHDNNYICTYNLSYILEDFKKFLEYFCIKKSDFESNSEFKKIITFNVDDDGKLLSGRVSDFSNSLESSTATILGNKKDGKTIQKFPLLEIFKGWNLISLPVEAKLFKDNSNIPEIPPIGLNYYYFNIFGNYESIWIYKDKNWIKNPSTLQKAEGIWINSTLDLNINLNGRNYFTDLINLDSGWHLMGTGNIIENLNLLACDGCDIEAIWKFTNSNKKWIENPAIINSGEGFWIKKR